MSDTSTNTDENTIGNEETQSESASVTKPRVGLWVYQDGASNTSLTEGNMMAFSIVSDSPDIDGKDILLDVEETGDMLDFDVEDFTGIVFDRSLADLKKSDGETPETRYGEVREIDGKTYYLHTIWLSTVNDDIAEIAATVKVTLQTSPDYDIMDEGEAQYCAPSISMVMNDDDVADDPGKANVSMDVENISVRPRQRAGITASIEGVGRYLVGFQIEFRGRTYKRFRPLRGGAPTRVTGWMGRRGETFKVSIVPADKLLEVFGQRSLDLMKQRAGGRVVVGEYEIVGNASTTITVR